MLVLGTANRKKGLELADLFRPVGAKLQTLADFSVDFEVDENGDTFTANARLKAAGYAIHLGQWVLADDSGLLVDALNGQPGVFSARYSGPDATDASNNRLLLERLGDLPLERRARFRPKATPPVGDGSSSRPAAKTDSATIRSSRSSNTIARLPNWGPMPKPA
jgi:non-canonical purine NTP pyrophosphatase (RdgB/HAM1 family)